MRNEKNSEATPSFSLFEVDLSKNPEVNISYKYLANIYEMDFHLLWCIFIIFNKHIAKLNYKIQELKLRNKSHPIASFNEILEKTSA